MGRTDDTNRVTAVDIETARRVWVWAMGTPQEAGARHLLVELVERARRQGK